MQRGSIAEDRTRSDISASDSELGDQLPISVCGPRSPAHQTLAW